jgi:signal transduction histidine kinase
LVAFDPAAVTRHFHLWPVTIEAVVVDGLPLPRAGSPAPLRVMSGARTFDFRYTSPNPITAERLTFRYQLEGLDRGWVEAGRNRVASYNRLPPGEYTFRVMANGPQGNWLETPTALPLVVVPHFFERRPVQAVAGLAFVVVVAGSVWRLERARSRRRLERLKMRYALDRERQRIARDIHDDLGAGLTEIILLSDNLREEIRPLQTGEKMVGEIATRARALTRSMDEVVWAINPQNDTLESFMTYLNKFAQEFLTRAGVHCRWDVPLELPNVSLSAETRHSLFLASKETLNKIVKHAGATEVWIRLAIGPGEFCLAFEDNGKGLQAAAQSTGRNGLANIQHRLAELRGRCEVVSVPGKGTGIKFVVRVGQPMAPDTLGER